MAASSFCLLVCRSSHEERGLKSSEELMMVYDASRRSSHEERGLKFAVTVDVFKPRSRRSSHEERGLKYGIGGCVWHPWRVAPRMRSVD